MSEFAKTTVFVAVAVAALALLTGLHLTGQSWLPEVTPQEMIGKPLFDDFEPLDVTQIKIIKYDEGSGEIDSFEVAQVGGKWSIPSHEDYPTDAKDQLAEAAESVMGRTVLTVETDSPGDHELYGVLDPGSKTLKPGALGVGTRVTMKGKNAEGKPDQTLLDLVIGKEVGGKSELRYVRRAGQDPVYTMEISTSKLSTKFKDWIEEDLLKLNSWDIKQVQIKDYSVDEVNGTLLQRADMVLEYDDTGDTKWKLNVDKRFDQNQWVDNDPLAEDEELDTDKLNGLKSALDDLEIVDVRKKPAGLSRDLKAAGDFTNNNEAVASLMSKGFYVAAVGDRVELFSNEGEIRCLMKDGVEYLLRFGNITGDASAGSGESEGEAGEDSSGSGLNRYIFVVAEFNDSVIPQPELEQVPDEAKAEGEAPAAKAGEEAKAADAPDDANSSDTEGNEKSDQEKERERIEKENKRKQDEYDEKIAEGKKKVKELNDRFADWYYVISDEVYQKIHLGRDDIVKKKEKEEGNDKESTEADTSATEGAEAAKGDAAKGQPGETPAKESESPSGALNELDKLKDEGPGGAE